MAPQRLPGGGIRKVDAVTKIYVSATFEKQVFCFYVVLVKFSGGPGRVSRRAFGTHQRLQWGSLRKLDAVQGKPLASPGPAKGRRASTSDGTSLLILTFQFSVCATFGKYRELRCI